jgi:hypothetical protein
MKLQKYYLYYIDPSGDAMLLTNFMPAVDSSHQLARSKWSRHQSIAPWNAPLFFPTLEQAETFTEHQALNFLQHGQVLIARWISMEDCIRNIHTPAEL